METPQWNELADGVQHDLAEWLNVELDDTDKERLASLYNAGRFHAWNCPQCGDRVYWGEPDDWGDFQGVRQADYTSYPGDMERDAARYSAQMCDECRSGGNYGQAPLELTGIGEPSCWPE